MLVISCDAILFHHYIIHAGNKIKGPIWKYGLCVVNTEQYLVDNLKTTRRQMVMVLHARSQAS